MSAKLELPEEKSGAVRLFESSDQWRPIVGWHSNNEGFGGLHNKNGWALIRVVIQKSIDGTLKDLYDQPMIVENPGAVCVCQVGVKVGFMQVYRLSAERLINTGADYIIRLNQEKRWHELALTLGQWKLENPAGLSPAVSGKSLERFLLESAKIEAEQEAGFIISDACIKGRVNTNPSFFAHSQYVVYGRVKGVGDNHPEDKEIIGKSRLLSPKEIRRGVDSGVIDSGLTLAALGICGISY